MICRERRLRYLFHSDGAALKVCIIQIPYSTFLLLYSFHRAKSITILQLPLDSSSKILWP